jgi:hypothetical protein
LTGESDRAPLGWPLDWRALEPAQRKIWWEQLWRDAIRLGKRYRLGLRSGWWRDDVQVETLAALAAWTAGYDSGAWTDPSGKLQLLYDLDRIRALLRGGDDVFDPQRHEDEFSEHIDALKTEPAFP